MNIEYRMTALKIHIQLYAFFCKMQRIRLLFIKINISVPLKSGQININQTIPEKGKN